MRLPFAVSFFTGFVFFFAFSLASCSFMRLRSPFYERLMAILPCCMQHAACYKLLLLRGTFIFYATLQMHVKKGNEIIIAITTTKTLAMLTMMMMQHSCGKQVNKTSTYLCERESKSAYIHTYMHTFVYVWVPECVCVCVQINMWAAESAEMCPPAWLLIKKPQNAAFHYYCCCCCCCSIRAPSCCWLHVAVACHYR